MSVDHQLRGLGPVIMSVSELTAIDVMLREVANMRPLRTYPDPESPEHGPPHTVHVYGMAGVGPHAELHVAVRPDLAPAHPGAGGAHHMAFRAPDEQVQRQWLERLNQLRVPNSGWIDRYWFHSIYFREPGEALFEIATDGPGFGVDEDLATLGEKIALPPFLEPRRREIEAGLKSLD